MVCPYLEYRTHNATHEFDHPRAYCGVTEGFVSPMHADVCNDRDRFDHEGYCSVYQGAVAEELQETGETTAEEAGEAMAEETID